MGGREHLKKASAELTASHFAASVRESISAVESVVKVLQPDGDFSRALAKLEARTNIHGSLKQGFIKIYGFTSDEQGIRHALLEKDAPDVDETDAMFMIGACSAFVSYLINKSTVSRSAEVRRSGPKPANETPAGVRCTGGSWLIADAEHHP